MEVPLKFSLRRFDQLYVDPIRQSDLTSSINFKGVCVTRLMCSPLAGNFWSTQVLVHKGLIHGVMTSLLWQTGLQSWQACTITPAHSVGYKSFTCGGSNPTTADDIIYTLVSSAVGHLCQCRGSMNVLHWVKFIDTYSLGHWGRADVVT